MGKRKKLFSSILSFVMVIALTANNLVFAAADPSVKAEKTASWTSGSEGEIAEVKLRVTAKNGEVDSQIKQTTDIVLVIDNSGSMDDNNKLKNAKNAAKQFVNQLLTADNKGYVNIALVKYSTSAHEGREIKEKTFLGFPTGDFYEADKLGFTNNSSKLNDAIDYMYADGGTNIQAGLYLANQLLTGRNAENKIIVLLSDGEPTYSYMGTAIDTVETTLNDTQKSLKLLTEFDYDRTKGSGSNYTFEEYSFYSGLETEVPVTYYNSKGKRGWYDAEGNEYPNNEVIRKTNHDKKGSTGVVIVKEVIETVSDNGYPTISESYLAKDTATIYTIRYGTNNNNAKYVMENVASELGKAYSASSSATSITEVFNSISRDVKTVIGAGTGAYVEDVIPGYFTFIKDGVAFTGEYMVNGQKVTVTENKDTSGNRISTTVRWEIGELATGTTGDTVHELPYSVRFDKGTFLTGMTEEEKSSQVGKDVKIYTNESAILHYTVNSAKPGETPVMKEQKLEMESPYVSLKLGKYSITKNFEGNDASSAEYKVNERIDKKDGYAFDGDKVAVEFQLNDTDKARYQTPVVTPLLDENNKFTIDAEAENAILVEYKLKEYLVKFYDAKGTAYDDQTVKWGNDAVEPAVKPQKDGSAEFSYSFKGWRGSFNHVTDNLDIYPEFDKTTNSYTVKFIDRDGTSLADDQTVLYGEKAVIPASPSQPSDATEGHIYTFIGWVAEENSAAKPEDEVKGNLTFKATYQDDLKQMRVTYYIRNASGVYEKLNSEPDLVPYGTTVSSLPELTDAQRQFEKDRVQYSFDGTWKTSADGGVVFDTSYAVTADIEVYAQYSTAQIVFVHFLDYNGEHLQTVKTERGATNVKYPESAKEPFKAADYLFSYSFAGWMFGIGSDVMDVVAGPINSDTTVYACYTPTQRQITVNFYDVDPTTGDKIEVPIYSEVINSGMSVENPITAVSGSGIYVLKGTDTVVIQTITTDEYEYIYEKWDKPLNNIMTPPGVETYEIFAVYDEISLHTVTFVNYDDTEIKTVKVRDGENVTDPRFLSDFVTPQRESEEPEVYKWKFIGWDDMSKLSEVTEDRTVKAVYQKEYINYTVRFLDREGNEIPNSRIENANYGDNINTKFTVPSLQQRIETDATTYILKQDPWKNTDTSEGAPSAKSALESLTGHLTVQADYEEVWHYYNVYFMDENKKTELGSVKDITGGTIGVSIPASAKNPVKSKDRVNTYTFDCYVDSNGVPVDLSTLKVTSDVYLYARYTAEKREYTVNYYEVTYNTEKDSFSRNKEPLASIKTEYGVNPTAPEKGKDFSTEKFVFTANAWGTPNWENLGSDETVIDIEATYTKSIRKYQVRFYDATEENKNTTTVLYEDSIEYHGAISDKLANVKAEESAASKSSNSVGQYTYAFAGWVDAEGKTVDLEKETRLINADTEFYARYTRTLNQYTITYMEENAVPGDTPLAQVVSDYGKVYQEDTDLIAARKTAEGKVSETAKSKYTAEKTFTFGGWMMLNENNELVSADIELTGIVKKNVTVYASYKETTNKFTITYMAKEFNSKSNYVFGVVDTVNGGTEYILRTTGPSKASDSYRYTFDSWMIVNEAGEEISSENGKISSVEGNLTLYPEYTKNIIKRDKTVIEEWNPWERIPERNNPEPAAPVETEGGGEVTTTPEDTTPSETIPVDEIEIPEDDIPQGTPEEQADTAEQENNQGEERASDEMEAEEDSKPKSAPVLPKTGTVSEVLLYLIGFTLVLAGSVVVVEYRFKRKAE